MSNALFIVPAVALFALLLLPLTSTTEALRIPEMEEARVTIHLRIVELADHSVLVIKQTIVEFVRVCCESFGIPFDGYSEAGPYDTPEYDDVPGPTPSEGLAQGASLTAFTPTEKILGFSILGLLAVLSVVTLTIIAVTLQRKCRHKYDKLKDLEFMEEPDPVPEYQK